MASAAQPDVFRKGEGTSRLADADFLQWPVAADWRPTVEAFAAGAAGQRLARYLRERLAEGATIYPPHPFRALELTALAQVRMVILGQDPYHGPGQAEGLAFSVAPGVRLPPSLRNIFREMHGGIASAIPAHGSLVHWARRGVLLLNACLTVEQGNPASHAGKGWEALTDALVAQVAARATPCAYLLWGKQAQAKAQMIERIAADHRCDALVLQANHPSPLSARRPPVPFLGSGHFVRSREWLAAHGCQLDL